MHDPELVVDILQQIKGAGKTILSRFQTINSVEGFTNSDAGKEKLDAICMQLIAIGESLKKLDVITGQSLLVSHEISGRGGSRTAPTGCGHKGRTV